MVSFGLADEGRAGLITDVEAVGDGSVIAQLKRIKTLMSGSGSMRLTDGTTTATVRDLPTNDSLNVAITDASGNHVTSFGGGTQYAEFDIVPTPTGTAAMWQDDTAADVMVPINYSYPLPVQVRSPTVLSQRVTDTGGSSTAFTTFPAATGIRNYVTGYSAYNASATAGYIDLRDGTGGTILWTIPLPAGGGANLSGSPALFRGSVNTALAYDVSAALSTVYLSVSGYQSS